MLNKKRLDAFRMLNFTPAEKGVISRLPDAYKKFYNDVFKIEPKPVHYEVKQGRYEKDPETGLITPVQNVPLPTRFSKELGQVLLGGEMVIRGFEKRDKYARRVPKFWIPRLKRSVVYSEILNKHFSVIVTNRLILQIHEHKGFDNYLLENETCDLRTNIALKMKKKILLALLDRDLPYDEAKNQIIYEKYKKYIVPREDLEWFGLTIWEALEKQKSLEAKKMFEVVPLKHLYRMQLIEQLKNGGSEEEEPGELEDKPKSGWLAKIAKPFSSKTN